MGTLTFQAAAGGSLNLLGPNIAGTVNLTLPTADGTNGQPLQTNGSGTLSFANLGTAAGGTGLTSFTSGGVVYASSTSAITTGSSFVFDGTNVGIGVTAPNQKLQVNNTAAVSSFALFTNSTTGSTGSDGTYFGINSSGVAYIFNQENTAMLFGTNNGERMRIDSSGSVGIGTSSPVAAAKMTVQGGGSNGQGGIRLLSDDSFANGANYVAYGRRLDANASGGFAPGVLLARVNTAPAAITSGINLGRVAFGGSYDGTDANVVYGAQIAGYSSGTYSSISAATDLVFFTTPSGTAGGTTTGTANFGTERMRIDSAGIVTMSVYTAGTATFSAAGVISSVSDETWKIKDGVPVDTDSMLKKLEPGYWYYNDEKKEIFGVDRQLGFYAQNVNAAIGPEAAPTPEEGKPWGYYDRSVLAVTVMSLQKALATIESLTARIEALESKEIS